MPRSRPGAATRGSESLVRRGRNEGRVAHLMLIPWLVGLLLVTMGPLIASLALSFTDYSIFAAPKFVGLQNYERLLGDERFWKALTVTAQYVLLAVPLQLALALGLALALDRGLRGLTFYRAAFYLPSLLGTSVAIGMLWRQLFAADGLVNAFLAWFGIQGGNWLYQPDMALNTLIILHVWTFGSPMVIFLAGLRAIPVEVREAAMVDGAGPTRRFLSITLPLLSPMVLFNLILQMAGAFQAFNQAYVISEGTGRPQDSTLFYTLYLYIQGFVGYEMGYASALAWVLVAIIGAVTAFQFWLSRKWVHYADS